MTAAVLKSSVEDDRLSAARLEVEDSIVEEQGYVPVYRRVFCSAANMCIVIALTSPLSAIFVTGSYQIMYAGYWGLSWGWIIPTIFVLPEVLAIAELASSMPVNGAFYSLAVPGKEWTNAQLKGLSIGVVVLWSALMALRLERVAVIYILMALLILVQTLIFIFGLPIAHAAQKQPFASGSAALATWMVPMYMAEETHRASTEIPKSLIYTYSVTAISGLVVCLICAFCITDIEAAALDPLFMLILDHWGQKISSVFFLSVSPIGFIGGSGRLLTYAKQIAAFARDGELPYSSHFLYVHPRLNILPTLKPDHFRPAHIVRIFAGDRWVPGRSSLGRWSIPVHGFALLSQIFLVVMECFPPYREWTVYTFNYNSVVTVAAIVLSCLLYLVYGKKHYKGLNAEALASWRRHHGVIVSDGPLSCCETYPTV
ncbi:hypothetical protein BDV11DRAFT_207462 [Aspergillus similis]